MLALFMCVVVDGGGGGASSPTYPIPCRHVWILVHVCLWDSFFEMLPTCMDPTDMLQTLD